MTSARSPMTEEQARKQVKKEKAFYSGLVTYIVVMTGLAVLNLLTSPENLWFIWPLLGWGIGVVSQGIGTFGMRGMSGWEERRVQALAGQEVSEARLRRMLDEELDERAVPAGAPQSADHLQRRIEHLEAIVTSRDWDIAASLPDFKAPFHPEAPLASYLDDGEALGDETPSEQAARIARRVR